MGMSCLDCHDYMDGYNRGKREGVIEELEKIKAEIINNSVTRTIVIDSVGCAYCKYTDSVISRDNAIDIIDKSIIELKGE